MFSEMAKAPDEVSREDVAEAVVEATGVVLQDEDAVVLSSP